MAKRHDFSYFFHEGLSNMFSHGFMSFAAIGITVACLLIMGTFTLVAVNANELLTTLEQENEILAYVDDSYTETQARALKSRLEAIPNVASVTFISRDEAMEDFKAQYPDEELFQDLDPEILEAARGMGSTGTQALFRVKLPMAAGVILAGVRNMVVMTISVAGIASFVGAGGLGVAVYRGITIYDPAMTAAGSILIALLAIVCDLALGALERYFKKRGS